MSDLNQIEMANLEQLVDKSHPYRQLLAIVDFEKLCKPIRDLDYVGQSGANGYGIVTLFQCLLLQFIEDISDRELERYLRENNSAKLFCGFGLVAATPDFSFFTRVRKRIGTKRLSQMFANIRDALKNQGLISEVFTFVDATHLISKANLWQERDKILAQGYEKLNNETLPKAACNQDARIGSKGKDKFGYGYYIPVRKNVSRLAPATWLWIGDGIIV